MQCAGQGSQMSHGRNACGDDPHGLLAKGGMSCQQLNSLYESLSHLTTATTCSADMMKMGWPVPGGTTRADVCPRQCLPEW